MEQKDPRDAVGRRVSFLFKREPGSRGYPPGGTHEAFVEEVRDVHGGDTAFIVEPGLSTALATDTTRILLSDLEDWEIIP